MLFLGNHSDPLHDISGPLYTNTMIPFPPTEYPMEFNIPHSRSYEQHTTYPDIADR
jgi:hypothetical protein